MVKEHDDARLVEEETPDEVVTQVPELRQFVNRQMAFERDVGGRHHVGCIGQDAWLNLSKRRDKLTCEDSGGNFGSLQTVGSDLNHEV